MTMVFDTTVLIDILRGRQDALDFLGAQEDLPACSEITRAEILRGIRSHERTKTHRLLTELSWHPVDRQVSELAGELGRKYRRSHHKIGATDLYVAATAQILRLPLATSNIKHFPMFPDLETPY